MRWIEIKAETGLSVNNLNQLVKERKKWQYSKEEKTDQSLIQGEGNGKPLL
jgi:hypothetical protein